ncbi:MAG: hypothetical protein CMN30_06205, partial [Sandaracinus sp.]|nr:hypothetical protein [Sandaracinus sp.]
MDAELERTWERLGIDGTTLTMAADGTLRAEPGGDESRSTEAAATSDAIPPLADSEVVLGPLLGEGGMGQVWLGEQRSLRRQVAVKGLRDAVDGALGRAALLREARVTGGLEHPNIVPVHVLVQTEDGAPRMVMKRVEGRSWTEVLADLRAEGEPLPEAHLEGHLRLLMQVCHAVHYAHARGVLHRDLKPDNVMVGDFGEVYVVDWGIAVALDDAEDLGDLPRARDVRGIVGTLPYMAPEMVAGDGAGLGVPTDVYLLGAILHELLTGHPRHRGDAVPQLVHAAWVSAPPAMGPAPEELVDLVTRATAKDPAARPSSADAFRSELEAFLTHREANLLAREGHERLAEAQAAEPRAAGNQAAGNQAAGNQAAGNQAAGNQAAGNQ